MWMGVTHLHLPSDPKALHIFQASTSWTLHDNHSYRFWSDTWVDGTTIAELTPLVYALDPRCRHRDHMVHQGQSTCIWVCNIHNALGPTTMVQYVELWQRLRPIQLSDGSDELRWNWTDSRQYLMNYCNLALFRGSILDPHCRLSSPLGRIVIKIGPAVEREKPEQVIPVVL